MDLWPLVIGCVLVGAWVAWVSMEIFHLSRENHRQDQVNEAVAGAWQMQGIKDTQMVGFIHANLEEISKALQAQQEAIKKLRTQDNDGDWWRRGGPSSN